MQLPAVADADAASGASLSYSVVKTSDDAVDAVAFDSAIGASAQRQFAATLSTSAPTFSAVAIATTRAGSVCVAAAPPKG